MKNLKQYISLTLVIFALVLPGCQEDNYELGDLVTPSNLSVSYEIVGEDNENPNGDGSGMVIFSATAENAITFNFEFGDGKDNSIAPSGKVTHTFSKNGVNAYMVTVYAVGTGGITSSKTVEVEVLSNFTDQEAFDFLTGGSSKTWYWAADQRGHLGLGPNDQVYENAEHTYAYWYEAAAFEKTESTLYLCEFVFTNVNGDLTFEHINPSGEAFIQGLYAEALGLGIEGSYPFEFGGVKNVSFSPSASIATEDGNYRGTTMNISDDGFMGFYAGSSEYEIIEVTENLLRVRVVQANEPTFAWYHIFTPVKPEN
ncbi:MAG: PKD domain-containing protein [Bacteroidales bacterium]